MADTDNTAAITPEQAAQMREQLAAYDIQKAADAAALHAATIKPWTDLRTSDAWAQFRVQITAAARACIDEPYYLQLQALDTISAGLSGQAAIDTVMAPASPPAA